jgi:hypothetical protein
MAKSSPRKRPTAAQKAKGDKAVKSAAKKIGRAVAEVATGGGYGVAKAVEKRNKAHRAKIKKILDR